MANSIYDFATSEASNSTTGGVNTAENQDPSTVNDGQRTWKQHTARFIDDLGAVNTVGGTGNAITITAAQGWDGYGTGAGQIATGTLLMFVAANSNSGAVTLNVNGIGAKQIRKFPSGPLASGDIVAGCRYLLIYDSAANSGNGAWILVNPEAVYVTGDQTVAGNKTLTGELTLTNTGLHLLDTNASHDLIIAPGTNLTADRTLTLTTPDSNQTINTTDGGTNLVFARGTYTPTATGLVNINSLSSPYGMWQRVGDMVVVTGGVTVAPTGAGATTFRLSLPIASTFTLQTQGSGAGASGTVVEAWTMRSTAATGDFTVQGVAATGGLRVVTFSAMYQIV